MIARVRVVDARRDTPTLCDHAFGQFDGRHSAPFNRHSCRGQLIDGGRVWTNHESSLSRGRRRQTVEIRRKKSELRFASILFQISLKLSRWKAFQHLVAFKNKDSSGKIAWPRSGEDMTAHIIAVRPYADLWIINEVH